MVLTCTPNSQPSWAAAEADRRRLLIGEREGELRRRVQRERERKRPQLYKEENFPLTRDSPARSDALVSRQLLNTDTS